MQSPFGVASARVGAHKPSALGNHACVLSVEEGRTGPDHACFRDTRHIHPLIRPVTAKSASSQGEALALMRSEQTQTQTQLKDMKMEFSS